MEYYNNIICVSYSELLELMPKNTLNSMLRRKNAECIHRGGGAGSKALVIYSTLPERYRKLYVEKYGDPNKLKAKAMIKEKITIDQKAREYYEHYMYVLKGEEKKLSDKLIEEYTINASVIKELIRTVNEIKAYRHKLGGSMANVWDSIFASSEKMRVRYNHTLPSNSSRLREKINLYKKEGYASLVSGKVGNTNTLKITKEAADQIIALKRCKIPVYTDTQLFERYNEIAMDNGWKPLRSLSGMKAWLSSPSIKQLWCDAVYGEKYASQLFGRKHKTELPMRRDSLWYGDGTKLNLYYLDKDGKVSTTCVYEVIDAYSEVLLGYFISDTENYEAQYHSYRMAIQISGHKPYEIVCDNQGGHKKLDSTGFLGKICEVHRNTAPYNAQSKTIESIFGRFQQQILHKDWRFTGQNITAKKDYSRANIEFIEANKDNLYTLSELKVAYAECRKEWNESKHPATGVSRMEMYNSSQNEETQPVSIYDMIDIFWIRNDKPCTFTDKGLQVTINGQKRSYEVFSSPGCPDHAWRRKHTYEKFEVAYDPYDLTSIRLYSIDASGRKRFERTAEPYMVIPRAIQDQKEGDAKFIRQEQAANLEDRIIRQEQAKAIEQAHGVSPEQNGLHTPELKGVNAEKRKEIARRTKKYTADPKSFCLGMAMKKVSLLDWKDVESKKETEEFSEQKAAGKL